MPLTPPKTIDIPGNAATATTDAKHFAISQTWQDLKAARDFATTYTNTTGRPICVSVALAGTGSGSTALVATVDGVPVQKQQGTYASSGTGTVSGIADDNLDLITRIYQGSVHFD